VVCCRVLRCVAEYCSVLQCVAVCCSVLQCVLVCTSVMQCVAVCCSVLQCVSVCCRSQEWPVLVWFMSHMPITDVAHINTSCHTCQWIMSHISASIESWDTHQMSHLTHINQLCCPTYKSVLSHIYMSVVTHINVNWVMPHTLIESFHTNQSALSHV